MAGISFGNRLVSWPQFLQKIESFLKQHSRLTGAAVLLGCLLLFHSNRGFLNASDSRAVVDLAWWMSQGKGFTLDGHPNYKPELNEWGYWAIRSGGRIISIYPTGTSFLAAPVYAGLRMLGADFSILKIPQQAKSIAALFMAISCWAIWLVLQRLYASVTAAVGIVLLASGSMIYSNMAQALWIQTGALFCQAMSFLFLFLLPEDESASRRRFPACFVAGVFACWAAVCRPGFVLWPLCALLFVVVSRPRRIIPFILGLTIAGIGGLLLNHATQGSWLGSYFIKASGVGFDWNPGKIITTAVALLFSPSRGLITFFPWTVVIVVGALLAFMQIRRRNWWILANAAFFAGTFLLLSAFKIWWGGYSSGPRLQCDLLFSGMFLAAPVLAWLTKRWWGIAVLLLLFIPSAFITHRQARLLQYAWEPAVPNYENHLNDWKRGNLRWLLTNGRIHRDLRGETAPVNTASPILNNRDPNVRAYLESGIWLRNNSAGFQLTARTANIIFSFDPPYDKSDLLLAVDVADNFEWGHIRRLRFSLNGHPIGDMETISGSGRKSGLFTIPSRRMGEKPYDRLTITERHPPLNQFGDDYVTFESLIMIPDIHPGAAQVRQRAAVK